MRTFAHRDLLNHKFGKLTPIEPAGFDGYFPLWKCKCDCGKDHITREHTLLNGLCKSCGCLHAEVMVKRRDDLTGKTFNRLTAIKYVGKDKKRQAIWQFKCICGGSYTGPGTGVKNSAVKSCGCQKDEARIANGHSNAIHGISKTLTGVSWIAMMQRSYNPNTKAYEKYGAVGIVPCEFIRATPLNLVLLIGFRTEKGLSLDRIENKFGYNCGSCAECLKNGWALNVRWATRVRQARNREFCQSMEINGVTKKLADWSEELGIPMSKLRYRKWKQDKQNANKK